MESSKEFASIFNLLYVRYNNKFMSSQLSFEQLLFSALLPLKTCTYTQAVSVLSYISSIYFFVLLHAVSISTTGQLQLLNGHCASFLL